MSRFLTVDIGAGTMDVLYYDDESDMHYKAVAKSPVRHLAEEAASLPGNLLITGNEMGGGPLTRVLAARSQEAEVVMSRSSAATVHHDLERVTSLGIRVIEDAEAEKLQDGENYSMLEIGDLQAERLKQIVQAFGVPFSFDVVGVCAQDHGVPPNGVSHLDYRHNLFKAILDKDPFPQALVYRSDELPDTFNRLTSIVQTAGTLPAKEIYVMDSGMAAILGASVDLHAWGKENLLILDVATSHTVGAAMRGGRIAGFFEYHTQDITLDRLESLLCDLADGKLDHKRILEEGGHGAYIRDAFGFESAEIIVATGPKRRLVDNSRFPVLFGGPLGDNMMTGAVGVLEAIRRHKGLRQIRYF